MFLKNTYGLGATSSKTDEPVYHDIVVYAITNPEDFQNYFFDDRMDNIVLSMQFMGTSDELAECIDEMLLLYPFPDYVVRSIPCYTKRQNIAV